MPGTLKNLFGRMTPARFEEPPASYDAAAADAGAEGASRRVVAAAIALSLAGVLSPIAVALVAATSATPWRPLAAGALIALLVLAPAGVGLATALVGLRRVAAVAEQARSEAEHAVLRVLVTTLLFGYALGLAAMPALDRLGADCMAVAAPGLVAAWALLLCVILWPVAPPLRRYGAIVFDVVLLSAFLHTGGGAAAGWYPLYPAAIFYAGLRCGLTPLAATAAASLIGFAAVVLSTDVWRQLPALAGGLLIALAVLPAFVAGAIRSLATARAAAAEAEAGRQRTLLLIADTLRGPTSTARAAGTAAMPVNDILDFAALEAGTFTPPVETFDLRTLVKRSLMPAQASAADKRIALRWRVDPRLPFRVRGQAQVFERILSGLAHHAIEVAQAAPVSITVEAGDGVHDARQVAVRLRVDALGAAGLDSDEEPLALRLVQRLVGLADGAFAIDQPAGRRARIAVTLPLAVEEGAPGLLLDLARRPIVIATEDDDLARELAEPLATWNGDPRWPNDPDAALVELARSSDTKRPVVIVDGRDKLLSALSLAHHAAQLGRDAPFVVLIAAEAQIASLGEVDEGGLDGFIPAPVTERLLANALHALPLEPVRPQPRLHAPPRRASERQRPGRAAPPRASERITPIAVHPKFASEAAPAVDERVLEGLRTIGGDPGFLREVIETFRSDAREIMDRVEEAADAADAANFARGLVALHRAAGHLGGVQVCELAASLQRLTPSELRLQGAVHVQRLAAEVERLAAALAAYLPAAEAGRL